MPPLRGRTLVSTDAGHVHVRALGEHEPDAPALLLLHQSPYSSRMWEPVMQRLAPLPCVAPDLLDHGGSDPAPRPLSLREHAELLLCAADEVAPGPKLLVGHHVGAALAAALVAARPERVAGLALIGYPLYRDWRDRYARFRFLAPTEPGADGAGLLERWRFVVDGFEPDAPAAARLADLADWLACGPIWYATYVALLTTDLEALLRDAAAARTPTAILAPDRDSLAAYVDGVAAITGAPVLPLAGGVRVTWEHPDAVAGPLRDLAARVFPA